MVQTKPNEWGLYLEINWWKYRIIGVMLNRDPESTIYMTFCTHDLNKLILTHTLAGYK